MRKKIARSVAMGLVALLIQQGSGAALGATAAPPTATPIKHLVVIFPENISFDHYFATYPVAANPTGEPAFTARAGTPTVNGLSSALLSPLTVGVPARAVNAGSPVGLAATG